MRGRRGWERAEREAGVARRVEYKVLRVISRQRGWVEKRTRETAREAQRPATPTRNSASLAMAGDATTVDDFMVAHARDFNCLADEDRTTRKRALQKLSSLPSTQPPDVLAHAWEAALPGLIEAVVYVGRGGASRAREVHEKYLAHYGRTAAQTPLVHFTGHTFEDVS